MTMRHGTGSCGEVVVICRLLAVVVLSGVETTPG
jgi:hypothetical protein